MQPLIKSSTGAPVTATPLGVVSQLRWLYIGGCAQPLSPGDQITWGELHLVAQEARIIYLGEEPLYCRAVLRPAKEEMQ